jgi:hypothetical protein
MTVSSAGIQLLLDQEVGGGQRYYDTHCAHPDWPGESSGVTIGIGYDLGYETSFIKDWQGILGDDDMLALAKCRGLRAETAKAALINVADIVVPWPSAFKVFTETTIPVCCQTTLSAFPGLDQLPQPVLDALVDLVYNRGASMDGDRRMEMRQVRACVAQKDIQGIAAAIRRMERIWIGTTIENDMVARRDAEATMVESALS